MENQTPEFQPEGQPEARPYAPSAESTENGGAAGLTAVKDRIARQAGTLGAQLSRTIDDNRTRASHGLRQTSQRLDRIAGYLEDHDSRDMGDALVRNAANTIRRYPGRSLLAGLLLGLALGRMFR